MPQPKDSGSDPTVIPIQGLVPTQGSLNKAYEEPLGLFWTILGTIFWTIRGCFGLFWGLYFGLLGAVLDYFGDYILDY